VLYGTQAEISGRLASHVTEISGRLASHVTEISGRLASHVTEISGRLASHVGGQGFGVSVCSALWQSYKDTKHSQLTKDRETKIERQE